MSRHDQRSPSPERAILCTSCKDFDCKKCIDVGRKLVFGERILMLCNCPHDYQFKS